MLMKCRSEWVNCGWLSDTRSIIVVASRRTLLITTHNFTPMRLDLAGAYLSSSEVCDISPSIGRSPSPSATFTSTILQVTRQWWTLCKTPSTTLQIYNKLDIPESNQCARECESVWEEPIHSAFRASAQLIYHPFAYFIDFYQRTEPKMHTFRGGVGHQFIHFAPTLRKSGRV